MDITSMEVTRTISLPSAGIQGAGVKTRGAPTVIMIPLALGVVATHGTPTAITILLPLVRLAPSPRAVAEAILGTLPATILPPLPEAILGTLTDTILLRLAEAIFGTRTAIIALLPLVRLVPFHRSGRVFQRLTSDHL